MPGRFAECRIHLLAWWEIETATWRHDPLALPFWRLYWNRDPGAEVIYDSHIHPIGPDRALLIAPETVFRTRCRASVRHAYAHFTIDGTPWRPLPGVHAVAMDAYRRHCLDAALAGRGADADADENAALWQAIVWCGCCVADWPEALRHVHRIGAHVDRACQHLRQHLHRQVDNEELAVLVDMNTNAFIRAFKRDTGLTPQHWHHRQRIEAACIGLAGSADGIDHIAEAFGYCDRHHFSRVFKRLRGLGPAAYRRSAQRAS